MAREAELSTFDLRYESYRMKNPVHEARVLASIAERGIEEPLEGVDTKGTRILLNGFKRYRCARKLKMGIVPYSSLGADEATAILELMRISNHKSLSILEQARFVEDLKNLHEMSIAEIAEDLSRSKSWVSMRLGLITEMSETVREKIFSGAFPVYPYMYTVRQLMRMNGVRKPDVEAFVEAVSGKKLSVRDIEQLAHGFFRGPESFREAILRGHIALPLEQMRQVPQNAEGCSEFERGMLRDLELAQKYMQRVMGKCHDPKLKSRVFHAQANLLTAGILSRMSPFSRTMRAFHDRTGQA
jgi:hypothetical protein